MKSCRIAKNGTLFLFTTLLFMLSVTAVVGSELLLTFPHARTAALNNSFVGVTDDSNSMLFNPAGLGFAKNNSVSLTHFASFADINYEYLNFTLVQNNYTVGVAVLYDSVSDFYLIEDYVATEPVNNYDIMMAGFLAYKLESKTSIGIGIKVFKSELHIYSSQGIGFDIGGVTLLSDNLSIGFSIQNIGFQTAYDEEADDLPLILRLGAEYKLKIHEYYNILFLLELDRLIQSRYPADIGVGLEMEIYNLIYLGVGSGYEQGSLSFSAGCGFVPVNFMKVYYAFQPFDDLGFTHRLSLDIYFD